MTRQLAKSKEQSPPTQPSPSRGEGKGWGEKGIALLHPIHSPLSRRGWRGDEKGIALVMILVMSAIALAIMAGLIYMITAGTQISGLQKRYETAREAGKGGINITFEVIGDRGDPGILGINFYPPSSDCLAAKLLKATSPTNWASCSDYNKAISSDIITSDTATYDFRFDLGESPYPTYTIYSKIIDTVEGNTAQETGLIQGGVVWSKTIVYPAVRPYLYTIELVAENSANPSERAKYSILYQY